ncbi:cysteine hydrolase [Paenibacillus sp. BSR1-1]|uniref:isochorismatase family cysteine hydrolase n=1 Tax=Paenibacillus sp. BSR1-1 TaxID=3020845 RepID=UPI0025B18795|nr:isochorismatase family cysteine hydrolase [Paenibacillus sp. BSR1-1]MDN3015435.1 cysteine hydrolase [Paenibacillus sp. BSR1-1]
MFKPNPSNTAIVITDPQNDFLSPGGKGYHLTKKNIEHYNTLGNLEILIRTAMSRGYQLFVSPHYLYPHDYNWQFTGAEQEMLLKLRMYQKQNDYTSFGADWVPSLKPYILSNQTVIATAHKIASPQTNDLVYQLRQHSKEKVILAGVLSNICVESHMRDLIENGFQTAVVYDATATISEKDFQAAVTNYHAFSSAVWSTQQAISLL